MTHSTKVLKHADFGNQLRRWRAERFTDIAEFCDATRLSIPAAVYERYENGEDLPLAEELQELATVLARDIREVLLAWAESQVTAKEHKAFFGELRLPYAVPADKKIAPGKPDRTKIDSNQIPESAHPATWVFGDFEREQLARFPWLLDFLIGLATVHPNGIPIASYGFLGDEELNIFVARYIKHWLDEGTLIMDSSAATGGAPGFRLAKPYIHMPKNAEWQPMRDVLLGRVLETLIPQMTPEMIAAGKSHRTFLHKVLTEEQFKFWTAKLAAIEMEFSLSKSAIIPGQAVGSGQVYSLMMLMAPRELKLPEHITKTRKKFPNAA